MRHHAIARLLGAARSLCQASCFERAKPRRIALQILLRERAGAGLVTAAETLVERVDLYSGGYPARLGRFSGGVVSAEATTPRTDTHGEANVRLFDAGGLVGTGFAGGRGTVLLGGRYSYTALLFSILVPDLQLDYRDYQARVKRTC